MDTFFMSEKGGKNQLILKWILALKFFSPEDSHMSYGCTVNVPAQPKDVQQEKSLYHIEVVKLFS